VHTVWKGSTGTILLDDITSGPIAGGDGTTPDCELQGRYAENRTRQEAQTGVFVVTVLAIADSALLGILGGLIAGPPGAGAGLAFGVAASSLYILSLREALVSEAVCAGDRVRQACYMAQEAAEIEEQELPHQEQQQSHADYTDQQETCNAYAKYDYENEDGNDCTLTCAQTYEHGECTAGCAEVCVDTSE
jgi:hypothetical protein